jgi:hypothetical protein
VDTFYLSDYERGVRFTFWDLYKYFDIDFYSVDDFNGVSDDWCGIDEEDDNTTRLEKWHSYMHKFPYVKSYNDFTIE